MNASVLKSLPPKSASWKRWLLGISISAVVTLLVAVLACYLFPQQVLTVDSGPVKADAMVLLGGTGMERPERAAELFKQGEAPEILVCGEGDCVSNEKLLEQNGVTNAAIFLECKSHTTRENAEFSIPMLHALGAKRVIIVTSWYHSRRALACFEHYAPDLKFYSRPSYAGYLRQAQGADNGRQTTDNGQRTGEDGRRPGEVSSQTSRASACEVANPNFTGQGRLHGPEKADFSVSEFQLSAFNARQRAERKAQEGYVKSEYLKLLGYWVRYGVCPI